MTVNQSKRTWAYRCALIAAVTMLVLQQSHRLPRFVPQPIPTVAAEGRYLPAPGNRFHCPVVDKAGRKYAGWIAKQADSSSGPVFVHCVYMTPLAGLI